MTEDNRKLTGRALQKTNGPPSGVAVLDNAGIAYLQEQGEALEDYDGHCVELAGSIGGDRPGWDLVWIEATGGVLFPSRDNCVLWNLWKHHAVAVGPDGLVNDPWFPWLVLPVEHYTELAFPGQLVEVEFNPGREEGAPPELTGNRQGWDLLEVTGKRQADTTGN